MTIIVYPRNVQILVINTEELRSFVARLENQDHEDSIKYFHSYKNDMFISCKFHLSLSLSVSLLKSISLFFSPFFFIIYLFSFFFYSFLSFPFFLCQIVLCLPLSCVEKCHFLSFLVFCLVTSFVLSWILFNNIYCLLNKQWGQATSSFLEPC